MLWKDPGNFKIHRTQAMVIHLVGFVDDNNGQNNQFMKNGPPVPVDTMVTQTAHKIDTWKSLLRASGGGLELSKCNYHIMLRGFTMSGRPILKGGTHSPDIYINDEDTGQAYVIPQLSAHQQAQIRSNLKSPE